MTVANALNALNTDIQNARMAITNKGGTVTANGGSSQLANDIATIPSGGTTDVPLTRISDDNGNEIGTWYMNFVDANDNVFKVVLLDAQFRLNRGKWCSNTTSAVTDMPLYSNLRTSNVWESEETATQNTQLILDFCNAQSFTSTACSHCRSKYFIINGITYYGQLPNVPEMCEIAKKYNRLEELDISSSEYPLVNFTESRTIWTSNQRANNSGWNLGGSNNYGYLTSNTKNVDYLICPVLEIPA